MGGQAGRPSSFLQLPVPACTPEGLCLSQNLQQAAGTGQPTTGSAGLCVARRQALLGEEYL